MVIVAFLLGVVVVRWMRVVMLRPPIEFWLRVIVVVVVVAAMPVLLEIFLLPTTSMISSLSLASAQLQWGWRWDSMLSSCLLYSPSSSSMLLLLSSTMTTSYHPSLLLPPPLRRCIPLVLCTSWYQQYTIVEDFDVD